jgi:dGTPase
VTARTGYAAEAVERFVLEPVKSSRTGRSPFERDRARVLHSAALRRLAAKTQVVGVGLDDFPRTRLTHSLECAQIGRELAAAIGADPDVVDAGCLAHDLGHPPFGHNGELVLDRLAADCGGFEGNAQSLRVLTRLEAKVVDDVGRSAGLNLTRAVLDASTKYPWPRPHSPAAVGPPAGGPKYGVYPDDLPVFEWLRAGAPAGRSCLEAQIMDWSDDVAYSVHDLEDGIHAGYVPLSALADGRETAALVQIAAEHYSPQPAADLKAALQRLTAEPWWPPDFDGSRAGQVAVKRMTSELIGRLVAAALHATRDEYGRGPLSRYQAELVVPVESRAECAVLKAVAHHYVMDRYGARAVQEGERELIAELVAAMRDRAPEGLDPLFRESWEVASDDAGRLRVVIDQVASLTDLSAVRWHRRLCGGAAY